MFSRRDQKLIESFSESHPWFFRNHIDVQKPVRIRSCCFSIHFFELISGNSVRESTVNLIQLSFIARFEDQVLCRIQTDRSRYTDPTPYEKTDRQRYVSMLDAEMIQHPSSCLCVHTAPLTIVTNKHVSFRFDFRERRIVIVLDESSCFLVR